MPHLCHTCAGQEIYTEVNDKLEMSQIAQQKMQARSSRQAANPDSETLGGSICFNGYRENIWSEDLNKDLVLLMIHTHLSKNCFFMFFFHLLACSEGCLCFVLKGVSANHQQSFSCVGIRLPQCPLYDLEGTDPATCSQ